MKNLTYIYIYFFVIIHIYIYIYIRVGMNLYIYIQNLSKTNMKMRLVNHLMETMLEIGESYVKPIAEIDMEVWKLSLDYWMGY